MHACREGLAALHVKADVMSEQLRERDDRISAKLDAFPSLVKHLFNSCAAGLR